MLNRFITSAGAWLARQRRHLVWHIIVAPMMVLTVYYGLMAADRYVSESRVVVKRSEGGVQFGGFSIPFLGGFGGANAEDALHLREYIHSQDLLSRLDKQLELRKEFSSQGLDVVHMLPPWATNEDFLEMYRKRVEVGFDEKTGVLIIVTHGSTPQYAQRFNETVLKEAEQFINEVSHRMVREQIAFADQELLRARKSLDAAREKLLAYQNNRNVLDPAVSAEVTTRVIAELQGQLAAREVELNTLGSMLQDDAAQVVNLRQTIAGIKQQMAAEKSKLTSTKDDALNRMAAEFIDMRAMVDFHVDIYKIALASLEKMRVEAARKVKSLAVLSTPQLPEEAKYPRRLYMLGAWLFALCLLFGLVRLTLEIVEDHRD